MLPTDITGILTLDIFFKFLENFESIENHRKWLMSVMLNSIRNHYRDRKPQEDIDEMLYDVTLTYVNGFRDTRIIIKEAIDSSINDEDERTLIDLLAYSNYSYEHTAKSMGWTRKKVDYRYDSLVKRILDNLKKKGIKDIGELL